MRILLVLQGEGRGHQTQALAFAQLAKEKGHDILAAVVSTPNPGYIPTLLQENAPFPVHSVVSPGLAYTASHRLSLTQTLLQGIRYLPRILRSLDALHRLVLSLQPEWVVNFYEPLWGLYAGIYRPKVKMTAIAHQYLFFDPQFPFPTGRWMEKKAVLAFSRLTAWRADVVCGLSFTPWKTSTPRLRPIPPLLRQEVRQCPESTPTNDHWVAYFTQPAFVHDLLAWGQQHPEQSIHLFSQQKPTAVLPSHITWHPISAALFLEKLANCQALITTAGFESLAEAHFLGKPVYAIPLPGHFEQACNALDWARTGGGLIDDQLNLSRFQQWLQKNPTRHRPTWHLADFCPEFYPTFSPKKTI